MATFAEIERYNSGNVDVIFGTLTLGTYATGGESVSASTLNCKAILAVKPCGAFVKTDKTDAVFGSWVRGTSDTTGKVAVYRQKDPAAAGGADIAAPEVTNAVSLAAYSALVEVVARF